MSDHPTTLTEAERAAVRDLLDLHVLADDERPVWSLVERIKADAAGLAARTPTATGGTGCRCGSNHGVGFVVHQPPCLFATTATGDDLRDRVTADLRQVLALADEATINPLTDMARGFRRGVLDALGDAISIVENADASPAPVASRPEAEVKRDEFSAERREQIIEALSRWEDDDGRYGYDKAANMLHAHEVEWCGVLDGPDAAASFATDPEAGGDS